MMKNNKEVGCRLLRKVYKRSKFKNVWSIFGGENLMNEAINNTDANSDNWYILICFVFFKTNTHPQKSS